MKPIADESKMLEMLAQGFSVAAIAQAMGYRTVKGAHSSMRRRGITRRWIDGSVPVVEVRRGRAP